MGNATMADFRVRFKQRPQGNIGIFEWGEFQTVRNTTADGAIDIARIWLGDKIETAGVDCRLIQEGGNSCGQLGS